MKREIGTDAGQMKNMYNLIYTCLVHDKFPLRSIRNDERLQGIGLLSFRT